MSSRLSKEARDLLPFFAGTLLCIVVAFAIWGGQAYAMGIFVVALGGVSMAGCSFGHEFQYRTLGLLLAQPVERRVLWREKMIVLGAGLTLTLVSYLACVGSFQLAGAEGENVFSRAMVVEIVVPVSIVALCAFSATPYLTLLLKSGLSGVAYSLVLPFVILAAGALVSVEFGVLLLVIYCGVCFGLGYVRFKRLQVLESATQELGMPGWMGDRLARPLSQVFRGAKGPLGNLIKKELRLQQTTFMAALLFGIAALAGAGLGWRRPDFVSGILAAGGTVYMFMIPLVAGAVGGAEERGWGTAGWQLSLPPSAREQWSVKVLVVLATSLVLGLAVPLVLWFAGERFFGFFSAHPSVPFGTVLLVWALAQVVLTNLAIYTGSFSTSTLKAILWALAILLAGTLVSVQGTLELMHGYGYGGPEPGGEPVIFYDVGDPDQGWWWLIMGVSLAALVAIVQRLAFSNYRRSVLRVRNLIAQVLSILLIIAFLTAGLTVLSLL